MEMATLQRYLEKSNEKLNINSENLNYFAYLLSKRTIFQ